MPRHDRTNLDGLLVLDKPGGMTSRAVVNRAQGWFPRGTRLGHTGTLDPLATGVLVLCMGAATRLAEFVQDMGKTYRAGLLLGMHSDTDDADGAVTAVEGATPPDLETVSTGLQRFLGTIDQVPPAYSAAKVTGRRAHDLARSGQTVTLQARKVHIDAIEILHFAYPHLEIEVRCGKGTYIRSLARDLGAQLGCGALIQTLRRTRVGDFTAEGALTLDATTSAARAALLPLGRAVAGLPKVQLPAEKVQALSKGQSVEFAEDLEGAKRMVAVFGEGEALYAIAEWDPELLRLKPAKVMRMPAAVIP